MFYLYGRKNSMKYATVELWDWHTTSMETVRNIILKDVTSCMWETATNISDKSGVAIFTTEALLPQPGGSPSDILAPTRHKAGRYIPEDRNVPKWYLPPVVRDEHQGEWGKFELKLLAFWISKEDWMSQLHV
jgi:hypothetical protein